MKPRTWLGIAVVGGLALASLDQRVQKVLQEITHQTTAEQSTSQQSGPKEESLDRYLKTGQFIRNRGLEVINAGNRAYSTFESTPYVSISPTNLKPKEPNEDTYSAGQTARLHLYVGNSSHLVKGFSLYEDNTPIRVWNEAMPAHMHSTSKKVQLVGRKGKHSYELLIWDGNGSVFKSSPPLNINYSGKITDLPPTIGQFYTHSSFAGTDYVAFSLNVQDFGDNTGIDEAIVYQNGQQVRVLKEIVEGSFGYNRFIIEGVKPGTYQFQFKVIDNGGHTVNSDPLKVTVGPTLQEKIEIIR